MIVFDGKVLLLNLWNATVFPLLRSEEGLFLLKPNVKWDTSFSEANGRSGCGVFKALLKRRAVSCLAIKRLEDDFLCWHCRSYATCATHRVRNAISIGPIMGWPSGCVVWKISTYFGEILLRNFVLTLVGLSVVRSGNVKKKSMFFPVRSMKA
jgi:hypothetical protein